MTAQTTNFLATETCNSCKFKLANPQDLQGDMACRRFPPQVIVLPVPAPMNQMQLRPAALYPAVHPKQPACGEWKPRLES